MSRTFRRTKIDKQYGSMEGFIERGVYTIPDCTDPAQYDWDRKYWSTKNHDGKFQLYGRRKGRRKYYRELTNALVRNQTRRTISRNMKSGDWDDSIYPTDHDGKQFIWSVW